MDSHYKYAPMLKVFHRSDAIIMVINVIGIPFVRSRPTFLMKISFFCHSDDIACLIWAGRQLHGFYGGHIWLFEWFIMQYSYGSKDWQINIHMTLMPKISMIVINPLQWRDYKGDISINIKLTINIILSFLLWWGCFSRTISIPWLLMTWLLASPGHQQP